MNTQAGDFYLSNEDADRIAASAGLSASEYDALAKAASMEQQQRNQAAVQQDIDNKMQILANLNAASRRSYKPAPIGFVPMGMTPVGEQARIPVSASERLDYATKARELQQEIQRNLSEAGMVQGPVITGPLTPTPPTGSKQPTPTPAPAAPEAAAASKEKEKPQYDPFAEFNRTNEIKQKFYDIALAELSQLPVSQRAAGLKLVGEIWNAQGPKPPQNMAVPLIDAMTGKPLEGYALIGGKVEKVEKPKVETKALTESQSKALQFATAMKEADDQVTNLLKSSNYDPTNPLSTLPMFETLKSQDRKLYEGTVRDFAVAILRRTSGAHVSPTEFKITEETYFPQSGDSEAVLKAKERRRKRDVASVYADVPEDLRSKILSQQPSQPSQGGGGVVVKAVRSPGGTLIKQ